MKTQLWLLAPVALLLVAACRAETPRPPIPTVAVASLQPGPSAPVIGPEEAIRIALASSSIGTSSMFPESVGSQTCQIRGGGPYPGIVVPGTCRTEVDASGSTYVVRFVEAWDASRFHYAGEPSSGELQHAWSFVVSATGVVVDQSSSGNFPPQDVK